ncbi:conserved protein of unknown function [Tenacibaculum sp. 190130A14a]|uniref:SRPBCC family protein n=1 Tax=Tenacibaculum polynesiense TaxID=3137857 RepID=A0ABM9PF43_9FLAO
MIDLKFKREINKPIDEVWSFVIDDFYSGHKWAYGTTHCRKRTLNEDFDRVCQTESGRLMDKITKIDNTNYILEFSVKGLPFFVKSVTSTWQLTKISETKTIISLGPCIHVMPVIGTLLQIPMKAQLKKIYPGILDDLVTYVETGKPSARKQKELDALQQ